MNTLTDKKGIWFIYDGECTICTYASSAVRIKEDYGQLFTLDARQNADDSLIQEINRRGLDLDEGMVIYTDGKFYHGKEVLKFLAKYGEGKNTLMTVFKGLFWSDHLAKVMYPWMRSVRNGLLRRKQIEPIDNLKLKNEPIFKAIFGDDWHKLPPIMKKHYANRPYTKDLNTVKGHLDLMCKPPLTWLSPLMKALGQIPTVNEEHVPVRVNFESDPDSKFFTFHRIFNFSSGKSYGFRSRMLQLKDNEVIELMKFGLGWKLAYHWDGEKVVLSHRGYALHFFGLFIPLPLTLLLGAGYAEEHPIDDNTFEMITHISHPLWGKVYQYNGRFELEDICAY